MLGVWILRVSESEGGPGVLTRRTPLRSTSRLERKTRLAPVNRARRAKAYARNFGPRADAVRAMPCLVAGCRRPTVAAHARARGMGGAKGDARELVPLCQPHHLEAGEHRTSQRAAFEARHSLDLTADAARIASLFDQQHGDPCTSTTAPR